MAAVSLSDLEISGSDPSFPAFWLPFQDMTAHNHNAQWTEVVVPPSNCGQAGATCSAQMPCCTDLSCDASMHCVGIVP